MNGYEKMREAITKAEAVIDAARMMVSQGQEYDLDLLDFYGALQMLRNALAIPRRQCDVGTAEEQTKRFCDFCERHRHSDLPRCEGCPLEDLPDGTGCEEAWAQMPYQEGETKCI